MASGGSSQMLPSQGKRTSFSGFPNTNATHLLERSRAGLRGSTPDSDAMASSDDEQDQLHRLHKVTSNPAAKPARRASWLTEGQQALNRNPSIGGGGPFSPVSPGATAPSGESILWGSNVTQNPNSGAGRGHSNATSFPWSNTIWNNDATKGPPQRLTEVMPSPTTVVPPGSAGIYGDENLVSPRETSAEQAIPFAIPLQPTPKTYRSQSYSVGQLDPEAVKAPPANYGGHNAYTRPRIGSSYAGLQHRPSRPSMLGEISHDPQLLGQLREVDDDEESLDSSDPGLQQSSDTARTIEQLTRENAMLRQAAAESRDRAAASQISPTTTQQHNARNRRSSGNAASEGSDPAVHEAEDLETQKVYRNDASSGRRFSEFGTKLGSHHTFTGMSDHRNMEVVKKGQWQSSLGFGGISELPQSRRHSFAEVPTRQNSAGPGNETHAGQEVADFSLPPGGKPMSPENYSEGIARPTAGDAVNYFSRMDPNMRGGDDHRTPSSQALHHAYMQSHYGRPQSYGVTQHRPKQLLYIVTFKCQRADVFYVQEGTGLQVNKGDLVIVEADRGTDLGTVASDNVPWAEAKELKDKFIEEHHRWLMMFSMHSQNGTVAGQNPNGPPQNAVIGSSSGQSGLHDIPSGELKPKMIKRVAQQHEIQSLREKEGAEAKAKRACQQKVSEHRLRMEILDAEFQMDWKKLTFFYFAECYINFNPLVTDLFKIYKTRIWMSAINTAAIASPAANAHLLSGPSHRNYSPEVDDYSARHQQRRNQESPSVGSPHVGFPPSDHMWTPGHEYGPTAPPTLGHVYGQPSPGPNFDLRQMNPMGPYGQAAGAMPPFYNSNEFAGANSQKALTFSQPEQRGAVTKERQDQNPDWNQSFQRFSLQN